MYLKRFNQEDIENEYLFLKEMKSENGFINNYYGMSYDDFLKEVPRIINYSLGKDISVGRVQQTLYFLWDDNKIVGLFKIRPFLNDELRNGSGHIGYGISQKYRNRGYATVGLGLAISEIRKYGVDEIYMAVEKNNIASLKVQLKNGAVIDHEDECEYYTRIRNTRNIFPLIDMHCDTLTALSDKNVPFVYNNAHISFDKMMASNYAMQCFAIFLYAPKGDLFKRCVTYIDFFDELMKKHHDFISPVREYDELVKNMKSDKMSAMLTIEEGGVLEGDIKKLEYLYNRGVRMMTLTWNFENEIGYPNINGQREINLYEANTCNGLKKFGIDVIRKMNELGMIIDCSHLSDAGFYDCIKYSKKPIVCSHSNARSVCSIVRNITDDMIIKLKENGGITGINYCPDFISKENQEDQLDAIVEHIKHIVRIGGIETVALGSDYDGIGTPYPLSDCSKQYLLIEALRKNGFTNSDLKKICYENFLRVWRAQG